MTLLDLFLEHFTWQQLLGGIAPLVLVGITAFFAGQAQGARMESERNLKRIRELEIRLLGSYPLSGDSEEAADVR